MTPLVLRLPLLNCVLVTAVAACHSSTAPIAGSGPTHPDGVITARRPLGFRPYGIAVSRDGVVLVVRADSNALTRADLPDTVFTRSIPVGAEPTNVTFDASGTRAYVTNQFSNTVGVVSVTSGVMVDAIPVTGNPFVVAVMPTDQSLFVSTNANEVDRIDASTKQVLARIGSGGAANGFAFSPSSARLYVSVPFAGTVLEVNTQTNAVSRSFSMLPKPQGLAVSRDGTKLYVAAETSTQLYVIDLSGGRISDSITVGAGGFDLQFTPDGAQLYLSRSNAGAVQIIDPGGRAVLKTLSTGGTPRRLAFNRDGTMGVIANESGWVTFVR